MCRWEVVGSSHSYNSSSRLLSAYYVPVMCQVLLHLMHYRQDHVAHLTEEKMEAERESTTLGLHSQLRQEVGLLAPSQGSWV